MMSDAEKFGHTVGRFFKKIDRTLSFLPEKPRKTVVTTAALTVSPLLACIIAAKTKVPENVDYRIEDNNESGQKEQALLTKVLKDDGEWDYGFSGFGYYIDGIKICGYDDDNNEH
jgi:putative membrane protein